MKKIIFLQLFLIFAVLNTACTSLQRETLYTISGRLTNYEGEPLAGGVIRLKGKGFENLFEVKTDSKGDFVLKAPKGHYLALYAVKDYGKKYLEFWHWNLFLNRDINKNIKIDTLELYGINSWKSYGGLMVYMRPMSLLKGKHNKREHPNSPNIKNISILPALSTKSIKLSIDGISSQVRKIQKVDEVVSPKGETIEGYLINASFPQKIDRNKEWYEICVDIIDKTSNEKGMACQDMHNRPWSF